MEGNNNKAGKEDSESPKLPTDLIYSEIFPRLPVKSIFQFKAVSRDWCSRLSEPSFVKSYLAQSLEDQRVGHIISVYSQSTDEHHFLVKSSARDPLTHILTLEASNPEFIYAEHVNGLVLLCSGVGSYINKVSVFNPSTTEKMDVPIRSANETYLDTCYSLGFDPSTKEFKILSIQIPKDSNSGAKAECGIFSLGTTNTWRTIDVEFPFNVTHWSSRFDNGSVCLDGIGHWILPTVYASPSQEIIEDTIATFDFKEEKFSRLDVPSEVLVPAAESTYGHDELLQMINYYLINFDGCLALVCYDDAEEDNTMDLWILKDYQEKEWVYHSLEFPVSWMRIGSPYPVCSVSKGVILFTPWRVSVDQIIIRYYDLERKTFTEHWVKLPEMLSSDDIQVNYIRTYAANILSLRIAAENH